MATFSVNVLASVIAGLILYWLCRWLDGKLK